MNNNISQIFFLILLLVFRLFANIHSSNPNLYYIIINSQRGFICRTIFNIILNILNTRFNSSSFPILIFIRFLHISFSYFSLFYFQYIIRVHRLKISIQGRSNLTYIHFPHRYYPPLSQSSLLIPKQEISSNREIPAARQKS